MVEEDSEKSAGEKAAEGGAPRHPAASQNYLPPPSPAHRAAMALNISISLAPPPRVETRAASQNINSGPIAGTDMKKTGQDNRQQASQQEQSLEIDMGGGRLASSRNPINECGQYIGKAPPSQKNEPAVLKPQARPLSAGAARLIAKRRTMMEGQDQAGSFKLPGPGPDTTGSS